MDNLRIEDNDLRTNQQRKYVPFEVIDVMVQNFFENQYQDFLKNKDNPKKNKTLNEISQNFKVIQIKEIKSLFPNDSKESQEYNNIVKNLREIFQSRLKEISFVEKHEAFFIFDSGINLIKSEINIINFVKYLCAGNVEALKDLCYRLLKRFTYTNRNIVRLLRKGADLDIFPAATQISDIGSLSRLRDDIATTLFGFFPPNFWMEKASEYKLQKNQYADILATVFKKYSKESIKEEIIDDRENLLVMFVNYFIFLHINMDFFFYSKKRWEFTKKILINFTQSTYPDENAKNNDPRHNLWLRKLLVSGLMGNKQFLPNKELILSLVSDDLEKIDFNNIKSQQKEFFDQLAPSTLHKIQSDLSFTLSFLSSMQKGESEENVIEKILNTNFLVNEEESFSLMGVWFIDMYDKGLLTKTPKIQEKVTAIRTQIKKINEEHENIQQSTKDTLTKRVITSEIRKSTKSMLLANQEYKMVQTSQIFFSGKNKGCIMREYDDSTKVFRDERVMKSFSNVFRILFHHIGKTENNEKLIKNITLQIRGNKKIHEYYFPFSIKEGHNNYLFAIGTTVVQGAVVKESKVIESFLPYVILFGEISMNEEIGHLSRRVYGSNTEWHHMPYNYKNSNLYYKFLFDILHLLPKEGWQNVDTQKCLYYLKTILSPSKVEISYLIDRLWRNERPNTGKGMLS